jgi:hypothetical protein
MSPKSSDGLDSREIYKKVIADIEGRADMGKHKYGHTLRPHNGRSALQDLYEELLDAVQYLRQLMEEESDARPD